MFGRRQYQIKRVLVVEDEPLIAFDTEYQLREEGFTVIATTDSVTEALDHLSDADRPDLILLDLNLRDGPGEDVARAAFTAGIPVLLITGRPAHEVPEIGIGCLGKPYRARDLINAIHVCDRVLRDDRPQYAPKGLRLFHSVAH